MGKLLSVLVLAASLTVLSARPGGKRGKFRNGKGKGKGKGKSIVSPRTLNNLQQVGQSLVDKVDNAVGSKYNVERLLQVTWDQYGNGFKKTLNQKLNQFQKDHRKDANMVNNIQLKDVASKLVQNSGKYGGKQMGKLARNTSRKIVGNKGQLNLMKTVSRGINQGVRALDKAGKGLNKCKIGIPMEGCPNRG